MANCSNYTEYFDFFCRILRFGETEILKYLLNARLIGRMFEFLYELKTKKKNNSSGNSNNGSYESTILAYEVPPIPLLGLPAQESSKR